jgi:hypothetical protein
MDAQICIKYVLRVFSDIIALSDFGASNRTVSFYSIFGTFHLIGSPSTAKFHNARSTYVLWAIFMSQNCTDFLPYFVCIKRTYPGNIPIHTPTCTSSKLLHAELFWTVLSLIMKYVQNCYVRFRRFCHVALEFLLCYSLISVDHFFRS